ncbi:MAG: hypothetical protein WD048_03960 [Chitinophagales bacterium]
MKIETITVGTNPDNIVPYLKKLMQGNWKSATTPPLWDGKAAERIVDKIIDLYS